MSKHNAPEETPTLFILHPFKYRISFDEFLLVGDFYLDFTLLDYNSPNAIEQCDTQSLANYINNSYKGVEPLKRLSAKIIASDDPVLIAQGVPNL
jgi:hypothetical protein